jgi:hydroxymethylglutaryl-CoA reductase
MDTQMIDGFSKLTREERIRKIASLVPGIPDAENLLRSFWHPDPGIQERFGSFSENTISGYHLPFGVAPNFLINGKWYLVPMVTEESSVVAATSFAAKFWSRTGGFQARVTGQTKIGQIHFSWQGSPELISSLFNRLCNELRTSAAHLLERMEKRGGGLKDFQLRQIQAGGEKCYQLLIGFDTVDSMGANFINSCLEQMAAQLAVFLRNNWPHFRYELIMAILSNYNPQCMAEVDVTCAVKDLDVIGGGLAPGDLARKMKLAVDIAREDVYRATTHNKGIFNGIDAVLIATGNDFRAVEAGAHAYAAHDGQYRSLSTVGISDGEFRLSLRLPLALGTVGGLTSLHPMAEFSLHLLGNPSAADLMQIVAAAGLASNFAAVRSLVTSGIQHGHMKMHLSNILAGFKASDKEKELARQHFTQHPVSHAAVSDFLQLLRKT